MRAEFNGLRPPGGKALVRLLQLLESAGYTETANATVQSALGEEEARQEFWELDTRFTAAPGGETPSDETSPSSGSRAYSDEGETADAEPSGAVAEDIARTYLEVGEQLGPPTPTGPQW